MNLSLPKIPQSRNAGRSLAGIALFSLILVAAGCQTTSPSSEGGSSAASKDMTATSLSVAASYLDSGRPDKAMHELQPLLEQYPNNIEALNLMGITQLALHNPNRAVLHLEKAWRLKPTSAVGVNLSSSYLELKRPRDAEKIIIILAQRKEKPTYPYKERIYHNYGLVALQTGRMQLAEKMFKRAVEENPMFYLSHMQLATMYTERKKPALAQKQLESARFACPHCFDPMEALVKIHAAKGDQKMARQLIQDYKLTEGLAAYDRRRVRELENTLYNTAQKPPQANTVTK